MHSGIQLTPPEPYAVYVLKCAIGDADASIKRAFEMHGKPPWWLNPSFEAAVRYYVGSTGRPVDRLIEHIDPDIEASEYTTVFKPIELKEVEWYRKYRDAANRERERAVELRKKYPEAFVYWN